MEKSGINALRDMLNESVVVPSSTLSIPMNLRQLDIGKVSFECIEMNSFAVDDSPIHTHVVASILETVMGYTVKSTLNVDQSFRTMEFSIKLLMDVPNTKDLVVEGTTIHKSNSLAISDGTIKDKEGIIYAYSTATYKIN